MEATLSLLPSSRPLLFSSKAKFLSSSPLAPRGGIALLHARAQLPSSFSSSLERVVLPARASIEHAFQSVVNNKALRNSAFLAMNTLVAVLPAIAEEEEKGKIFDFNLTLPIIVVEFLVLMYALDAIFIKPVSKVMDERDEAIRQKLMGVRDNSGEIKALQEEAEGILKAARAETTAALNQMKRETAAALDEKLQQSRERIEAELAIALKNLEEQKEQTLRSLDAQVQSISDDIVRKVIPF